MTWCKYSANEQLHNESSREMARGQQLMIAGTALRSWQTIMVSKNFQLGYLSRIVMCWLHNLAAALLDEERDNTNAERENNHLLAMRCKALKQELTRAKSEGAKSEGSKSEGAVRTSPDALLKASLGIVNLRSECATLKSIMSEMQEEHSAQIKYTRIVFHSLKSQLVADMAIAQETAANEQDNVKRLRHQVPSTLHCAAPNACFH